MAKKFKLTEEKKKEIAAYLCSLYSIYEQNDKSVIDNLDEWWSRYTGQHSAKKDKSFPWNGAADIQTGIVSYSCSGIEARYSSALNSVQLVNISSQVSAASNAAAKNAQNWLNNFWRHKSGVNDVLLEAFQYNTVEGSFFIQIVPDVSKRKVKRFSVRKIVDGAKAMFQSLVGQDGEMQAEDKEINDFIAARWVNIPRRLIKFDNSANTIQKCGAVCIEFEKSPAEIFELSKRKDNPWYNVKDILRSIKPNDLPTAENESDDDDTKNDYIGYSNTLTHKKKFYQWWIAYNVGTPDAPDYKEMTFIISKDTGNLVYDEENSFFDKRKPVVSGKCRRIAGKIDGQGIPMYIGALNDAIDIVIDQALDNNTLSNTITGTYIPGAGFDPDKHKLEPGKFAPVKSNDIIKQWKFESRLQDIAGIEGILQGFLERKSLVSDYSLGRESSINKKATMRGTAMLLQEYGLNLDPLMQNTQEALKEGIKQTLQCAYEFMPAEGITYSYQDKETQEYKQATLTRQDLEFIDDWDIVVLQGAVDVMVNADKQGAVALYQALGQDQTGETNTYFLKENLVDKLAPRDKSKVMRSPKEMQMLQMIQQKAQELQQREAMIMQTEKVMSDAKQQMIGEYAKHEEEKFIHAMDVKGVPPEQREQLIAQFRQQFISRKMAERNGNPAPEIPPQESAPVAHPGAPME